MRRPLASPLAFSLAVSAKTIVFIKFLLLSGAA